MKMVQWSFSGWEYATLSSGGGWTLITFGRLALALVFALTVVAARFAEFREQGSISWIAELPFGVGLPVLAAGVRAVVRAEVAARA